MRLVIVALLLLLGYCSSDTGSPRRQRANTNQNPPTFAGLEAATVHSNGTVTLSWTAASDAVTPASAMVYDICLNTASGACATAFTANYSTTPGATVYTLSNLPTGAQYYVVVRARNEWGLHDSNTVEHTITIPGWFNYWGSLTGESERIKAIAASDDGYVIALELQTSTFTQTHYPFLGSLTPTVAYPGSIGGAKQSMFIKLNHNAEAQWFTFVGQSSATYHETLALATANDGGVVALLRANGPITSMASQSPLNSYNLNNDFLLVKFNSGGGIAWFTFWGGMGEDFPQSLTILPDGNILALGSSNQSTGSPSVGYSYQGGYDAVLVSFSATGAYQSHRYLGANSSQFAMAFTNSSNQIAVGLYSDENFLVHSQNPLVSYSFGSAGAIALIVFSLDLSYQWHTFLGVNSGDVELKALRFNGSNLYFTATTNQTISSFDSKSPLLGHQGSDDILLGTYDATTGALQWFTYVGSAASEKPIGLLTQGSNILVAGNCAVNISSFGSQNPRYSFGGHQDICLFQYNPAGALQWYSFTSLSGTDTLYAVAQGTAGQLLLAGSYSASPPASQIDGINAQGAHNKSSGEPSSGVLLNFTPEGKIK